MPTRERQKRLTKLRISRASESRRTKPPEGDHSKLIEDCAKDISLFAAVFFPKHVEQKFSGAFHLPLFAALHRLAQNTLTKNDPSYGNILKENKNELKVISNEINNKNIYQQKEQKKGKEAEKAENFDSSTTSLPKNGSIRSNLEVNLVGESIGNESYPFCPLVGKEQKAEPEKIEQKINEINRPIYSPNRVRIVTTARVLQDPFRSEHTQALDILGDVKQPEQLIEAEKIAGIEGLDLRFKKVGGSEALGEVAGTALSPIQFSHNIPSPTSIVESSNNLDPPSEPGTSFAPTLSTTNYLSHFFSSENSSNASCHKLVVAAPRGHAKTTIVSMIYALWCVAYKMADFIILMSDSEDQSVLNLDAIKNELENNTALISVFGSLVGPVWGTFTCETSNGIRLLCRGSGQRLRGLKFRHSRPSLIIVDDLESDEGVETSEQRQKLKRWFYGTVIPSLSADGKIVAIGTIIHEDSLLANLLEASDWVSMRFDAEEGFHGETLWPEVFSKRKLEDIRISYAQQGQGHIYFREYRNLIIDPASAPFKKNDFIHWSEKEWEEFTEDHSTISFLTLDPAYTISTSSDFSAFVICSTDEQNRLFVRKVFRGKFSLTELVKLWIDLHFRYRVREDGIQSIDWKKSLETPLIEEMRRRNVFFNVRPLKTYSQTRGMFNKKSRIERLSPRYATGSVIHVGEQRMLEEELLSFPRGKHDDVIDALSMQLDFIHAAPKKPKEKNKYLRLFEENADSISGY